MKIKILFCSILGCMIFWNCRKENTASLPVPSGYAGAFINPNDLITFGTIPNTPFCTATKEIPGLGTIPWIANTFTYYIRSNYYEPYYNERLLYVTLNTFQDASTDYRSLRENIGMELPLKEGKYIVNNNPIEELKNNEPFTQISYGRLLDDGDVADALWRPDLKQCNYVTIANLDTINDRVTLSFDLHFKMHWRADNGKLSEQHSDYTNFKGAFSAKIKR